MEQSKEKFVYEYSASQQDEIKKIREKYMEKEESKMDMLRRLDRSVTQKGELYSLCIGIIGTLVMGVGMCCVMVWDMMLLGILIGLVGIAGIAVAYPVYSSITKKQREKLAPEILRLTEELMK